MMKEKKAVLRTCVVTKESLEKKDLFRVVRTPEKEVVIDLKGKANGRGAYLKKDKEVILKALKTKVLDRQLEVEVPESIYEELLKLL
ncbi:MAG: YlxR family protein [Acholeplasmatales bacterium]|nr:YlxR family protein [Acholeplasmatales bacterium]